MSIFNLFDTIHARKCLNCQEDLEQVHQGDGWRCSGCGLLYFEKTYQLLEEFNG